MIDNRKSHLGYFFRLGQASNSRSSKKQASTALSTTETEYMAMSYTSRHLIWLKLAKKDLKFSYNPILYANPNVHGSKRIMLD